MTCSTCLNIWSEGSLAQFWNTLGRQILRKYVHQTLIHVYTNYEQRYFVLLAKVFFYIWRGV